jgi:hypothetical protein
MRDIYYEELRKNCAESTKFTTEQMEKVINAIKNVLKFHAIARKEGLLSLEEECKSLDKEIEEKYFAELLILVVDGTDSILVREYALSRYFAANFIGHEGILYLIYLKGALMIKAGDHPVVVEQILEAMLPENVRKLYIEKKREEFERFKETEQEDLQKKIDSICSKNCEADEKEHTLLSEASIIFENRTDQVIQRILREVDCNELTVAMKGLSGNACRKIFDNLSKRIAAMVVEDIETMGPVRMKDVDDSVIKILNVVLKLAKAGEIVDDNLVALKVVMDIYNSDKAARNMYKDRYGMLKRALDDIWEC